MSDILQQILANKRAEVERARVERPLADLRRMRGFATPPRNFYGAVSAPRRNRPNLIAEIKRSSPSAGVIRTDFDPAAIARSYADGGAAALSVLTDERFFDGRLEYIETVRAEVGLPVLRKDFIVDPYQVYESRACGADAILLIAEALDVAVLVRLLRLATELKMCVLVEVHSRPALIDVFQHVPGELRADMLLGINNRDLKTQTIDAAATERLIDLVPPGVPVVSESGIHTRQGVERVFSAGARAILMGEALMRSDDPCLAIRTLFGPPEDEL